MSVPPAYVTGESNFDTAVIGDLIFEFLITIKLATILSFLIHVPSVHTVD